MLLAAARELISRLQPGWPDWNPYSSYREMGLK